VNNGINGPWYFANNKWPAGEREGDSAATTAVPNSTVVDGVDYALPRETATDSDILNAGTHYPTASETALLQEIAEAIRQ
jgi:hypothetical protein